MALESFNEDDNLFSASPNIIKGTGFDGLKGKENILNINDKSGTVAVKKVKKTAVPSNITCHCSGKNLKSC